MSMMTRLPVPARLTRMFLAIVLVIAGAAAAAGALVVAQEDDTNEIQACVNRITGAVRIVQDSDDCTRYESALSWNQQGQQGPQGEQGELGQACWDLNGNGVRDVDTEDLNADGEVNVADCQGPSGVSTAFSNSDTGRVFPLYAESLSDVQNHLVVNSLELPAGEFIVQARVEFANFLAEDFVPLPQNVECYLRSNSVLVGGSFASTTVAPGFVGGPIASSSGVATQSTHNALTLNEPATVEQLCFVQAVESEFFGEPASMEASDRHMTAIQVDTID